MKKMVAFLMCALVALTMFAGCKKEETTNSEEVSQEIMKVDSPVQARAVELAQQTPIPDYHASEYLVGFLIPFNQGEYSMAAAHGFLRQAESLGYAAKLYRLDDTTQESIDAKVEEMKKDGCAGALVWASTPELVQAATDLRNADMKVVVPFYDMGGGVVDANLLTDPNDYGSEAARIMCEELISRKYESGVIAISGAFLEPTLASVFENYIKENYPQFTVEYVDNALTPESIQAYIKKTPAIHGALVLPADTAIQWEYACKAVQNELKPTPTPTPVPAATSNDTDKADNSPTATPKPTATPQPTPTPTPDVSYKRNVVIIAMDYSESNLEAVDSGYVFALIARPYFDSTAQSMNVLSRLLRVLPTQTNIKLNTPVVRRKGVTKYTSLRKEYVSWFKGSDSWFPATPTPAPTETPAPETASSTPLPSVASTTSSEQTAATASASDATSTETQATTPAA